MGKRGKRVERTRCGKKWTEARFKQFVVGLLREGHLRWGPKYAAFEQAYVGRGKSPTTGRPCKLHLCDECQEVFPKNAVVADHINPVVDPVDGFQGWDIYVDRMFQEVDGYRILCKGCHQDVTNRQSLIRRKKLSSSKPIRRRGK